MNQDAWVWRDYLVDNPVDEKLGKVLDKMIANVLPQRFQSAAEVLVALDQTSVCPNILTTGNSVLSISSIIKPAIPTTQSTSRESGRHKFKKELFYINLRKRSKLI
jgi:hypothetical protein